MVEASLVQKYLYLDELTPLSCLQQLAGQSELCGSSYGDGTGESLRARAGMQHRVT